MGRKPTGRNSYMTRVPLDLDRKKLLWLYYEVLPVIEGLHEQALEHSLDEPRWQKVKQFLAEIDYSSWSEGT
jgi:hypothetical protein